MKKKKFIINSLAFAGLSAITAIAAPARTEQDNPSENSKGLFDIFTKAKDIKIAQHRSHASHGSHGSHRSSSTGPSITPKYSTPRSNSTPPSSILPKNSMPGSNSPTPLEQFTLRVRRVQTGLMAYGYYNGFIDGQVGPETKSALAKFQKDYGMSITGTITQEVLDAFGIK